jgi:hypothetical protein
MPYKSIEVIYFIFLALTLLCRYGGDEECILNFGEQISWQIEKVRFGHREVGCEDGRWLEVV